MSDSKGLRFGDLLHGEAASGTLNIPNITDAIYDAIWRRIVNLEFAPGTRLSDEGLSREFGVSRTPVREALYRLSQVGLVQVNARRGFFVSQLNRQSIEELYDLRTALESWAILQATPHIAAADLAPQFDAIEARLASVDASSPEDAESFVRSDLGLHALCVGRAGNDRLRQILKDINGQLAITVLRLALSPEARLRAIEEHQRILESLVTADPRSAARAMEDHIQGVKGRVLQEFHFQADIGNR
jgi:DNA-binding GntR family transcriptional regulator